jgi:phenylpropionate dioxygenase-like ring-hydroxylating dioxygenase large terminal subunit
VSTSRFEAALRRFWHPVARSDAVTSAAPLVVEVLGERLVVFRTDAGTATALRDVCAHRGTALSLGKVSGGNIECPYHGWVYGADGRCTRIPSLSEDAPVPPKAQVPTYPCRERFELLWVNLAGAADATLPTFADWGDESLREVVCGPYHLEASAPRVVENNVDQAHFPFVHEGVLGTRDRTSVSPSPCELDEERGQIRFSFESDEPRRSLGSLHLDGAGDVVRYTYHQTIALPLTTHTRKVGPGGQEFDFVFAASPTTATRTTVFVVTRRNYALDQPDADFERRIREILEQDRAMVESQRPHLLPVDLGAELHLGSERYAVQYRRWLARLGVEGAPDDPDDPLDLDEELP